jgi:phosphonate degradation associated HDIG domain protein
MTQETAKTPAEVTALIRDILVRRGSESYLGEAVSMSEHMLQSAWIAEQAGETNSVVVAALLHDIGHYTSEFGEDFLEQGVDNLHEHAGARVLENWFPPEVVEATRSHVAAKRYLCAVEPDYFAGLSPASVQSLELQGGPMNSDEVTSFRDNPWLDTIVRVRRYDDGGKVAGRKTPELEHYLGMVEQVLEDYVAAA